MIMTFLLTAFSRINSNLMVTFYPHQGKTAFYSAISGPQWITIAIASKEIMPYVKCKMRPSGLMDTYFTF